MSTNLEIHVREGEKIEDVLKRMRRMMRKEGLMEKIRALDHYEKPSDKKHRKKRYSIQKCQRQEQGGSSKPETIPYEKRPWKK